LFILGNGKGGAFFFVEGAAGFIVFAGFFQPYAAVDHVDYVDAGEQVINKGLRDSSGHRGYRLLFF